MRLTRFVQEGLEIKSGELLCAVVVFFLGANAKWAQAAPDPLLPEPSGLPKNRFVSVLAPPTSAGAEVAIRITLVELPGINPPLGFNYWFGEPFSVFDYTGRPDFTASRLQCTPYYTDWTEMIPGCVVRSAL